jgi:hypothetical protein
MHSGTTLCHKYGHPEFLLQIHDESVAASRIDWLLNWLQREVTNGKKFLPDQIVQIGWSLLKVFPRENGTLGLLEPDFKSLPINFVDSVSNTLLHLLLQKSVAESLGLERDLNLPSLQHAAILCDKFGTRTEVFLSRVAPVKADSGWFFGCDDARHNHEITENLRRVSLYEAAVKIDERIIPYLGLPEGIEIRAHNSAPHFFLNGKALEIKQNSYLHKKFGVLR